MIMNCHYIDMQLERIRNAGIGAGAELSSEGSSGLEEQLQIIESAVSRIRTRCGGDPTPGVLYLARALETLLHPRRRCHSRA